MARSALQEKFRRLGRHGAVYAVGSLGERLAALLLLPLYTQVLPPAQFGVLGLILLTGQLAGTVCALGLRAGLFRSYYDYHEQRARRAVVGTVLWLTSAGSLVLLLGGLPGAGVLARWLCDSPAYRIHFVLLILFTVIDLFNQVAFALLRARQQARSYVLLHAGSLLLRVGLILYFVLLRELSVLGVLLGQLVGGALTAPALALCVRGQLSSAFLPGEARVLLRYGAPLALVGVFGFVSTYADRYVLKYYAGLEDVGLYTLAYQLGMVMVLGLITPLKLVWGPVFLSVKDEADFRLFCARTLTYVWFLGGWLFLAVSLLSRELLRVMAAPEYWAAYRPVPLIALAYLVWSSRSILEVGAVLGRKTPAIAAITAAGAALNLLLNFALIPRWGVSGAALATLVSFSATTLLDLLYNQRLFRVGYEWGRLLRLSGVMGGLLLVGWLAADQSLSVSLLRKLLVIGVYPLLLRAAGFFERPELARLRQALRRLGFGGRAR